MKKIEHAVKELVHYTRFKQAQPAALTLLDLTKKISSDNARLKLCNDFIWQVASHCAIYVAK